MSLSSRIQLFSAKKKLVSYFPVPNHSPKNTHKNVRPVFGWRPFTPPAIGCHGKRRIFHALDHLKTIQRHNRNGNHVVFLEQDAFVQQQNKFLLHFPVPNHSLKNTHKNVRPLFGWRPPSFFHFAR